MPYGYSNIRATILSSVTLLLLTVLALTIQSHPEPVETLIPQIEMVATPSNAYDSTLSLTPEATDTPAPELVPSPPT